MFTVTYLDDERGNSKRRTVQTWDDKSSAEDYARILRRLLYANVRVVETSKAIGLLFSVD